MKIFIKRIQAWFEERKRFKNLRARVLQFAGKESFHVVLDVSGSMYYYIRENNVDIYRILRQILRIRAYALYYLDHSLKHIQTITSPKHVDALKMELGGGTDASLVKNLKDTPVIFITDIYSSEIPKNTKVLTLCIHNEPMIPVGISAAISYRELMNVSN